MQSLLQSELKKQYAQPTYDTPQFVTSYNSFPPQMMLSSAASSVPPHHQFAPFPWPHHPQTLQQQQQSMAPQPHEEQPQLRAVSSEDVRFGAGAFSDGEAERSTRRRGGGGN